MQDSSRDQIERRIAEDRIRALSAATERRDLVDMETGEIVESATVSTTGGIRISAARPPRTIRQSEGRFSMLVHRAARQALTGEGGPRPMSASEAQLFLWLITTPTSDGHLFKLNLSKAAREMSVSANTVRAAREGLLDLGVLQEAVPPGAGQGGVYAVDPSVVWAGSGQHDSRRRQAAVEAWG